MGNEPPIGAESAVPTCSARSLTMNDLERVAAIDRANSGHLRHHFFEKSFAAAGASPIDFIHIGVTRDEVLCGFAIAHILRGEFGREQAIAVLDALAVEPESQERGVGRALMQELNAAMRRAGVQVLQSQVDWRHHDLMRFVDAAGFSLAPRIALERSVAEPLSEISEDV